MLRDGNQIKLHETDIRQLELLTGVKPTDITTVDDWNRFIDYHLQSVEMHSVALQLRRRLLEGERLRPVHAQLIPSLQK